MSSPLSHRSLEFVLKRRQLSNRGLGFAIAHYVGGVKETILMNTQSKIIASVGVMLFAATASFAQQVKTDYDRKTDFSQYRSYSWEKVQTKHPLFVDRIKNAVDAALAAKGWTLAPSGGNVAVVALETTQNKQTLDTFYN